MGIDRIKKEVDSGDGQRTRALVPKEGGIATLSSALSWGPATPPGPSLGQKAERHLFRERHEFLCSWDRVGNSKSWGGWPS